MTKQIPLTKGKVALVDDADYEWLMQWKWHTSSGRYAARAEYLPDGTRRYLYMHRAILDAPSEMMVDHINGNGFDDQRNNLRLCMRIENGCNRGPNKNGLSRFKGVNLDKATGKWRAKIKSNGKQTHLGLFATPVEAARAYDAAAKELHGEFARLNFSEA